MSYETASNILIQSAELGVKSIKTNWRGESSLHPEFEKITSLAKNLGFVDRISNSNFKFRTDNDSIFRGFANQTKVKVSLDSFDAEVFETQRAGGKHAVTMANVDKFYAWPGRTSKIVIQAVRTTLNKDEPIEDTVRLRWPDAEVSIRDMVGGRTEQETEEIKDLENKARDNSERQTCNQAHVRIIFGHDGRAFPCCPGIKETLCVGNIKQNTLYEIFNGVRARTLRKDLKSGKAFDCHQECKNCSSFESYKGFKPVWGS
jgi:radical SAM protein with 4Fe4S-binding SPASM domain